MAHNVVDTHAIFIGQIRAQRNVGLMLLFWIGIGPIVEINQFDAQPVIVNRVAPLPNAAPGVPGPMDILHMLNNLSIFANGVMGTYLGGGVVGSRWR